MLSKLGFLRKCSNDSTVHACRPDTTCLKLANGTVLQPSTVMYEQRTTYSTKQDSTRQYNTTTYSRTETTVQYYSTVPRMRSELPLRRHRGCPPGNGKCLQYSTVQYNLRRAVQLSARPLRYSAARTVPHHAETPSTTWENNTAQGLRKHNATRFGSAPYYALDVWIQCSAVASSARAALRTDAARVAGWMG